MENFRIRNHVAGSCARVEAWLMDFDGDLYGRRMRVEVVRRIRGIHRSPRCPGWSIRQGELDGRRILAE